MPTVAPGFKATAEYFERGAAKQPPGSERRRRLSEAAQFYRTLSAIIPKAPPIFQEQPSTGNRWRDRSEFCLALKQSMNPIVQKQLLDTALLYRRRSDLDV